MPGSCMWQKSHLLPCQIRTGALSLAIDINTSEKGETKAAHHHQESLELLLPNSAMYPEVKTQSSLMGPVVWWGKKYPSGVLPPENIVRKILWELYEVNFIHELQSLDRRTCANLNLSSAGQLFNMQVQISQCFHTSSF